MRSSSTAVVLVGHGSKAKRFDGAMRRVASSLRRGPFREVRCAYLEINPPSIGEAISGAIRRGAKEVRVLPYFVLSGRHVTEHIPQLVNEARRRAGRKATVRLCPFLGFDERIVSVVKDRLK